MIHLHEIKPHRTEIELAGAWYVKHHNIAWPVDTVINWIKGLSESESGTAFVMQMWKKNGCPTDGWDVFDD